MKDHKAKSRGPKVQYVTSKADREEGEREGETMQGKARNRGVNGVCSRVKGRLGSLISGTEMARFAAHSRTSCEDSRDFPSRTSQPTIKSQASCPTEWCTDPRGRREFAAMIQLKVRIYEVVVNRVLSGS